MGRTNYRCCLTFYRVLANTLFLATSFDTRHRVTFIIIGRSFFIAFTGVARSLIYIARIFSFISVFFFLSSLFLLFTYSRVLFIRLMSSNYDSRLMRICFNDNLLFRCIHEKKTIQLIIDWYASITIRQRYCAFPSSKFYYFVFFDEKRNRVRH